MTLHATCINKEFCAAAEAVLGFSKMESPKTVVNP